MSVPLATLRRHSQIVWLHDALGLSAPMQGQRVSFWHAGDAERWLRHWKGDDASMMSLRYALHRADTSAPVYSWNDDEVLEKLAARLVRSAVVALESAQPASLPVMPSAPVAPAIAEPPAIPVSQILAPIPAVKPPILPVLEEVQIEGAEVLPEIEQSLEQVEITLGEIKIAPVSLEPTPSKVPDIATAMTGAGASVTSSLDEL